MAKLPQFCISLLLAWTLVGLSVSVPSPETSPSPAPIAGADVPSPNAPVAGVISPTSDGTAPAIPPTASSPPAPPPADLAPGSSPAALPSKPLAPAPAPAPAPGSSNTGNINHDMTADAGDDSKGSPGGMSGRKKAGIAIGVILAAGAVLVGGVVYKKRRDNVRRSQYGYAARREIL